MNEALSLPKLPVRNLLLVLGDQLDPASLLYEGFDTGKDALWMAETHREATHVWCHKQRLTLFFSAMRHFRDEQRKRGRAVCYHELTSDPANDRGKDFVEILRKDLPKLQPQRLRVVLPGDYRVLRMLKSVAGELDLPLDVMEDRHFYNSPGEFKEWAEGKRSLVMEHFYRRMRKLHNILMDARGEPVGGEWNYDAENRETFGKSGPGKVPSPHAVEPDATTREVMALVEQRYAHHPGRLGSFSWPVTASGAQAALKDFIENRLPGFGTHEDAMWSGSHTLWHSRLSAALNLKLISPRDCVEAAVRAWKQGAAPLNSVEGFVRQILGWREFVRGVYWLHMPGYAEQNALECDDLDVPPFFWDGKTDMACVADCMDSVLEHGWSHHIPRLMVLGQYALLLGVHPHKFHEWHMAMYVDAIDWVSLPNTLGMSQYGDGGIVGTKPYCASGNYIQRMGNHCAGCRYNPKKATGPDACPFTTLYWSFLDRHRERFKHNRRMGFQLKNLERKSPEEIDAIRKTALGLKNH